MNRMPAPPLTLGEPLDRVRDDVLRRSRRKRREVVEQRLGRRCSDQADDREDDDERWSAVLKRTVKEFREDNVTDWAAALTYYGVLSIFPV
jgi:hypothetical protein